LPTAERSRQSSTILSSLAEQMLNLIQLPSANQRSQSSSCTVQMALKKSNSRRSRRHRAGGSWSPENRHVLELQRGTTSGLEAKLTTQVVLLFVKAASSPPTLTPSRYFINFYNQIDHGSYKPVFVLFSSVVMAVFELF